MKPRKTNLPFTLAILVVALSTMHARAFYDPNLGRWINRDPIGELGFRVAISPVTDAWLDADQPNLYTFTANNPVGFADPLGLEEYSSCSADKSHGGFAPTRSEPTGKHILLPFGGHADEMRVMQRKCNFRCYHQDTLNCYNIPCKNKSCQKDHGVAMQITINPSGSGAAATCKDIEDQVRRGALTGGSIVRNH